MQLAQDGCDFSDSKDIGGLRKNLTLVGRSRKNVTIPKSVDDYRVKTAIWAIYKYDMFCAALRGL